MIHVDLFSGIGGFSLALDRIYHEEKIEHIFVENDPFCQLVLKKHWPDAEYHGDIKQFIADARSEKQRGVSGVARKEDSAFRSCDFLTGGFPCQPFSQAGRRQGTADDRYLWPAMLECIALFRPEWVIAENVGGLASWNEGLVLETVCADLEKEGYEVQPIIIPAVAVGAPHRRDRIWFIANRHKWKSGPRNGPKSVQKKQSQFGPDNTSTGNDSDPLLTRLERFKSDETEGQHRQPNRARRNERPDWNQHWPEVAARLCRVDDGLPRRMDRNPRLKALGNAICPQVAEEIFKEIKSL